MRCSGGKNRAANLLFNVPSFLLMHENDNSQSSETVKLSEKSIQTCLHGMRSSFFNIVYIVCGKNNINFLRAVGVSETESREEVTSEMCLLRV